MKVILTFEEIRTKFGIPDDCELEVVGIAVKKDSDGWLNVPADWNVCHHPSGLSDDDLIQVMFRRGSIDIGRADDWDICWRQDGDPFDIVKFKVTGE